MTNEERKQLDADIPLRLVIGVFLRVIRRLKDAGHRSESEHLTERLSVLAGPDRTVREQFNDLSRLVAELANSASFKVSLCSSRGGPEAVSDIVELDKLCKAWATLEDDVSAALTSDYEVERQLDALKHVFHSKSIQGAKERGALDTDIRRRLSILRGKTTKKSQD